MAGFKGHVQSAAVIGVAGAAVGYHLGYLGGEQAVTCILLAAVGGIFPDVDSDYSHSIRVVFNVLSLAIVVGTALKAFEYLLHGVFAAAFTRYGVIWPFRRISKHRGMWHSIPMGALCAMVVYALATYLGAPVSLWYALFFFAGFITHLVVDEIVAYRNRAERFRWTALKLWSASNPWGYTVLYMALIALFIYNTDAERFGGTLNRYLS